MSDGTASDCETISVTVTATGTLVGDWKANEGSGTTLVDSSGLANNGTILGNPTWVAGQHGQAIRFDGTGDYATVADNASLDISGAITMATWVKPETAAYPVPDQEGHPGWHRRLRALAGDDARVPLRPLQLDRQRDHLPGRLTHGLSDQRHHVDAPRGHLRWHDDPAVCERGRGGRRSPPRPRSRRTTWRWASVANPDGVSTLQGAMDDILLYNRALSASEVAALATITPPNTPPTLDPIGNKNADAGTELAFTATASDPDAGDTLTFSLANGTWARCPRAPRSRAAGLHLDADSGRWAATPSMCACATAPLGLRDDHRDRGRGKRRPDPGPVGDKNATPAPSSPSPPPPPIPTWHALTFSLAAGSGGSVPVGASITSGGDFTWTPSSAQADRTPSMCASPTATSSTARRSPSPWPRPNAAPTLDLVGDKNATAGTQLAFTATATDPDLDALTFSLAAGSGGSVPVGASITSGGDFTWTPSGAQADRTPSMCASPTATSPTARRSPSPWPR